MNHTEHPAKSPAAKTGLFATVSNLLPAKGSGTPSLKLIALLALAVAAFLALTAAPSALAFDTHEFKASFGSAGSGDGQLQLAPNSGLAVNQATHNVYVADTGNHRVVEFSEAGAFIRAFGWGVATGASELQTCTATCQAGISGSAPGQLTAPNFIAVDNSAGGEGAVYVADTADNLVTKFSSAGALESGWGNNGAAEAPNGQLAGKTQAEPFSEIAGIAVDSAGILAVFEVEPHKLFKFTQSGAFGEEVETPRGTTAAGLAVDPAGNFFKLNGDRGVEEFGGSGGDVGQVTPNGVSLGGTTDARGLAVDSATGDLYVAEPERVAHYAFNGSGEVIEPGSSSCVVQPNPSLDPNGGCQPSDVFGSGSLGGAAGIAVNSTSGDAYVADASANQVDVFDPVTLPDVTTGPPSAISQTAATLHGTVNPAEAGGAKCSFAWGTTAALSETPVPCEPETVPDGNAPVPVHAELPGLQPNTTYFYRLGASNSQGTNHGQASETQEFTTTGPAGVLSTSATEVSADSATLEATIALHGLPTTYRFEYDTTPYGEGGPPHGTSVPIPDQGLGSGKGEAEVTQHIQGLAAATTYHYRVLTSAEIEPGVFAEAIGPDHAFTTQGPPAATLLPDSRQWQQVSPVNKFGAQVRPLDTGPVIQASTTGAAISYATTGPIEANPPANSNFSQVLSTRGPSVWASQGLATPHLVPTGTLESGPEYKLFSSDLALGIVQPTQLFNGLLSPAASEQTAYLRTNYLGSDPARPCTTSCYRPLVTGCPGEGPCPPAVAAIANVPPGTVFGEEDPVRRLCSNSLVSSCGPQFRGATPDLGHVVLESSVVLTTQPLTGTGLYEWGGESLALVGRSGIGGQESEAAFKAISADGSLVVFVGESEGLEGLLLRDTATGETVQLDAANSGCAECTGGGAKFQYASADGRRIFFTDGRRLTADAGASEGIPDLYECEIETAGALECRLSDLTPLGAGAEQAGVLGKVLGASSDGSWIYLATNGALTPEGVHHGTCETEFVHPARSCNLYALHFDGTAWEAPRLIAVLTGFDQPDWRLTPVAHTARVSPNGQWLAFQSQASLTGYDNRDAASGQRDQEVYLYHGGDGALICASCVPSGARPSGVEVPAIEDAAEEDNWIPKQVWDRQGQWLAAALPTWEQYGATGDQSVYQPRYLSDSGRLFFNSIDRLVPAAANRNADVYQYEPSGVGGCTIAVADQANVFFGGPGAPFNRAAAGCVGLISSGSAAVESEFLDASESGDDVFFLTTARLVGQDPDSAGDVYDAHVCSAASPCLPTPPPPAPACAGDACQAPATPPDHPTPGTSLLNGPGNLSEGAKHHKKKHHKHKKHHKKSHKKRTASHKRGGGK